jgi:hypothetical protein
MIEARRAAEAAEARFQNSPGPVPDAPFKKSWHELSMKRMIRWAAENGYDQIAWTTGDQQAKRYNKLMDGIQWLKYDPENGRVTAFHNGAIREVKRGVKPDNLPGIVGKDTAKRLLDAPKDEYDTHKIEGPLTIGGEGMKGFYDKMLVDFLNKYAKKWGAQVGETEVKTAHKVYTEEGARGKDPNGGIVREKVHSLPITPAMKKSVLEEGQPIARTAPPPVRRTPPLPPGRRTATPPVIPVLA